jgi:heme/copper-type cytochrome/quinol oxidase subunit 4
MVFHCIAYSYVNIGLTLALSCVLAMACATILVTKAIDEPRILMKMRFWSVLLSCSQSVLVQYLVRWLHKKSDTMHSTLLCVSVLSLFIVVIGLVAAIWTMASSNRDGSKPPQPK